jgi:hypothetical protein
MALASAIEQPYPSSTGTSQPSLCRRSCRKGCSQKSPEHPKVMTSAPSSSIAATASWKARSTARVGSPLVLVAGPRKGIVDVADRGAPVGETVLHHQVVVVHVVRLGQVDDAELVAQHRGDVHLGEGVGRHGDVIGPGDLPGLDKARLAAPEQHDGVVFPAFARLADDRQTRGRDQAELLPVFHRPIAVGGPRPHVQLPVHVFQQMLDVVVVHQPLFFRQIHVDLHGRMGAVGRQVKGENEQEPVLLFFLGHEWILLPRGGGP